MNNNFSLIELTAEQQALEDALFENGGELTPEMEEALEINSAAIVAKVDSYHAVLRKFEMAETALDAEIKRLTALKKTAANAQKSIKGRIAYAMQSNGIERLDGTFCKISFRKSKAIEVDEEALLADYQTDIATLWAKLPVYVTLDVKVSKSGVKTAMDAGENVKGATIVENSNIQIR